MYEKSSNNPKEKKTPRLFFVSFFPSLFFILVSKSLIHLLKFEEKGI